jgi:trigger factor
MNITRENTGNVNAVIKVLIEKPDYEKTVEETLKDYRQKSSLPGFRPGKAPIGLIKRRFGKAVLAEEINKMLSQNLTSYLIEEKIHILGEPLASHEHQKNIDWDKDEDFEFAFDIALAPDIQLNLDENIRLNYYNIKITDEMLDQQLEMIASQMGQQVEVDEVGEKTLIRGNFVELDEQGNEKEEGVRANDVLLSVELIKDEEIKKQFSGKKKEDTFIFNPVTAYNDRHEVGHLLKISHEQAHELNSNFNFTVNEITKFDKAELNQELFEKIYGEGTDVKTEEDLRNKIKEDISYNLKQASDRRYATDVRDSLVELINPELPEEFLKRWLREMNQDVTDEQIENDFEGFTKDLRWQLIKGFIAKSNDIKVEEDEMLDFAKQLANAQYSQYGIYNAPEEQLESFAKMLLDKPEEKERFYNKIIEDKVVAIVKEKTAVEEKEVTREEFEELAK